MKIMKIILTHLERNDKLGASESCSRAWNDFFNLLLPYISHTASKQQESETETKEEPKP
jgi:hypothetical protein